MLKLETRQRTGAFKDRGAANRMLQLSHAERERGVIAMSAGNHASLIKRSGSTFRPRS
jgi:threonine dehydratase